MKLFLDERLVILQPFLHLFALLGALLSILMADQVLTKLHEHLLVVAVCAVLNTATRNIHNDFLISHTFVASNNIEELLILRVHL